MHEQILGGHSSNKAAPRRTMDDLEDLLAQHASVTMNLGLKDHSVSRRDALLGQSMIEKDRAEARNMTRRGDGVAGVAVDFRAARTPAPRARPRPTGSPP